MRSKREPRPGGKRTGLAKHIIFINSSVLENNVARDRRQGARALFRAATAFAFGESAPPLLKRGGDDLLASK
jgi:hypothetical protein